MSADTGGAGAPQGLAWSWELDFGVLLDSLAEAGPGAAGISGANGCGGERLPASAVAGRVAERLAPGPDLVGWLSQAPAADLGDYDLAAVAGSWRRIASWAQARELAAVAQIASRAAARDEDIEVGADGRPARVAASAAAEVALELTMSQYGAAGWADLAVDLCWRLAATGEALATGVIDLPRARLIAEATGMLSDDAARDVEARVLPAAGRQTPGMLRAALRRAVLTADPEGAERRRKEAERQAKVSLYPDQETTATLAGQRLPGVHAAAAMARIKAMARAMRTAGAPGPIDLLCAQIYLGLLLGTMPPIPAAEGAPPDNPPDDDPGDEEPGDHGYGSGPDDDGCGSPDDDGTEDDGHRGPARDSRREDTSPDSGAADRGPDDDTPGDDTPGDDTPGGRGPGEDASGEGVPGDDAPGDDAPPPPGDADAPRDDDFPCPDDAPIGSDVHNEEDGWPEPDWPRLPAVIPPTFTRPAEGWPIPGLLDVSLPWQVLAGTSPGPGHLGRIGPITGPQARSLAGCAARDPAAQWRIIVTDPAGHALAVTRIRCHRQRPRQRDGPSLPQDGTGPEPGNGIGLVSRVTLTIPEDLLTPDTPLSRPPPAESLLTPDAPLSRPPPAESLGDPGRPGGILARALDAAAAAAARAGAAAAADAAAGGCAHTAASPGYRPPPRLRDYVTARDLTCRSGLGQQPAWRGDLDHTIAYDDGGLTCCCNLGGVCRTHHVLKHHPDWKLEQTAPGAFTWTTPSGRTFTATPDIHPL